jgi:hypothetical protein
MKNQLKYQLIPVLVAIAAILSGSTRADQTALMFDTTQFWSMQGGSGVFGWQFTTRSDIQISALGLFDNPGIYGGGFPGDGLIESHAIGIWDVSSPSSPLVSTLIPGGTVAPLVNGFRYVSIASVELPAGHDYVIGALFSDIEPKDLFTGAVNNPSFALTVSPEIKFGGYQWGSSSVLVFPDHNDPGTVAAFGPNFMCTAIPEPTTFVLAVMAVAVIGFCRFVIRKPQPNTRIGCTAAASNR